MGELSDIMYGGNTKRNKSSIDTSELSKLLYGNPEILQPTKSYSQKPITQQDVLDVKALGSNFGPDARLKVDAAIKSGAVKAPSFGESVGSLVENIGRNPLITNTIGPGFEAGMQALGGTVAAPFTAGFGLAEGIAGTAVRKQEDYKLGLQQLHNYNLRIKDLPNYQDLLNAGLNAFAQEKGVSPEQAAKDFATMQNNFAGLSVQAQRIKPGNISSGYDKLLSNINTDSLGANIAVTLGEKMNPFSALFANAQRETAYEQRLRETGADTSNEGTQAIAQALINAGNATQIPKPFENPNLQTQAALGGYLGDIGLQASMFAPIGLGIKKSLANRPIVGKPTFDINKGESPNFVNNRLAGNDGTPLTSGAFSARKSITPEVDSLSKPFVETINSKLVEMANKPPNEEVFPPPSLEELLQPMTTNTEAGFPLTPKDFTPLELKSDTLNALDALGITSIPETGWNTLTNTPEPMTNVINPEIAKYTKETPKVETPVVKPSLPPGKQVAQRQQLKPLVKLDMEKEIAPAVAHFNNIKSPEAKLDITETDFPNKVMAVKFSKFLKENNINKYTDLESYATGLTEKGNSVLNEFNTWLGKPENGGKSYTNFKALLKPSFIKKLKWDKFTILQGEKLKGFSGEPINVKRQATTSPTISGLRKIQSSLPAIAKDNPTDALLIGVGIEGGFRPGDLFRLKISDLEEGGGQLTLNKTLTNKTNAVHEGVNFLNEDLPEVYQQHLAKLKDLGYNITDPNTPLLPPEILKDYYKKDSKGKNTATPKLANIISSISGEKLGNYSLRKSTAVNEIAKEGRAYAADMLKANADNADYLLKNSEDTISAKDLDSDYKSKRGTLIEKAKTLVNEKLLTHVGEGSKATYMPTGVEALRAFNAGVREYLREKKTLKEQETTQETLTSKESEPLSPTEIIEKNTLSSGDTIGAHWSKATANEPGAYNNSIDNTIPATTFDGIKNDTKKILASLNKLVLRGWQKLARVAIKDEAKRNRYLLPKLTRNNPISEFVWKMSNGKLFGRFNIAADEVRGQVKWEGPEFEQSRRVIDLAGKYNTEVLNQFQHTINTASTGYVNELVAMMREATGLKGNSMLDSIRDVKDWTKIPEVIKKEVALFDSHPVSKTVFEAVEAYDKQDFKFTKPPKDGGKVFIEDIINKSKLSTEDKGRAKVLINKLAELNKKHFQFYDELTEASGNKPVKEDPALIHLIRDIRNGDSVVWSYLGKRSEIALSLDQYPNINGPKDLARRVYIHEILRNAEGIKHREVANKLEDEVISNYEKPLLEKYKAKRLTDVVLRHSAIENLLSSEMGNEVKAFARKLSDEFNRKVLEEWRQEGNNLELEKQAQTLARRVKSGKASRGELDALREQIRKSKAEFKERRQIEEGIKEKNKQLIDAERERLGELYNKKMRNFSELTVEELDSHPYFLDKATGESRLSKGIDNLFKKITVEKKLDEFISEEADRLLREWDNVLANGGDRTGIKNRMAELETHIANTKGLNTANKAKYLKEKLGVDVDKLLSTKFNPDNLEELFFSTKIKVPKNQVSLKVLDDIRPDTLKPRRGKAIFYDTPTELTDNANKMINDCVRTGVVNHTLGKFKEMMNGIPGDEGLSIAEKAAKLERGEKLKEKTKGIRDLLQEMGGRGIKIPPTDIRRFEELLINEVNHVTERTGVFVSPEGKLLGTVFGEIIGPMKVAINIRNIVSQLTQSYNAIHSFGLPQVTEAFRMLKEDPSANGLRKLYTKFSKNYSEARDIARIRGMGLASVDYSNRLTSGVDPVAAVAMGKWHTAISSVGPARVAIKGFSSALKTMDSFAREFTMDLVRHVDPKFFEEYKAAVYKLRDNNYIVTRLTPEEIAAISKMDNIVDIYNGGYGKANEQSLLKQPIWQLALGHLKRYDLQVMLGVHQRRINSFVKAIDEWRIEKKATNDPLGLLKEKLFTRENETYSRPIDLFSYYLWQPALVGIKGTAAYGLAKVALMGLGYSLAGMAWASATFNTQFGGSTETRDALKDASRKVLTFLPQLESQAVGYMRTHNATFGDWLSKILLNTAFYGGTSTVTGANVSESMESRFTDPTIFVNTLLAVSNVQRIFDGEDATPLEKYGATFRSILIPPLFNSIMQSQYDGLVHYQRKAKEEGGTDKFTAFEKADYKALQAFFLSGGNKLINIARNAPPRDKKWLERMAKAAFGFNSIEQSQDFLVANMQRKFEKWQLQDKATAETIIITKAKSFVKPEDQYDTIIKEVKKYQDKGLGLNPRELLRRLGRTTDYSAVILGKLKKASREKRLKEQVLDLKRSGTWSLFKAEVESKGNASLKQFVDTWDKVK